MPQFVRDIMTTNMVSIRHDVSAHVAVSLMLRHNVSALPVVDDAEYLIGLISEFDVLELFESSGIPDAGLTPCHTLMSREVKTIQAAAEIQVAIAIFRSARIRRLLVLDDQRLVGLLSRRDVLRGIHERVSAITS